MSNVVVSPVVFITGASSGIGAALVRRYAQSGASVVLCARRLEKMQALVEELKPLGARLLPVACDVTSASSVQAAVTLALREFGKIDVVVANAGIGVYGSVENLTMDDFSRQFATNVDGVIHTVQATLQELKRTKGRLAIVGSGYSYFTHQMLAPYTMSKYAVRALGETLAFELKPFGVSVTMIYPGVIGTEFRLNDPSGPRNEIMPRFFIMSAKTAAAKIKRALDCRRSSITLTMHAKFGIYMKNHFPWIYDRVIGMSARLISKYMDELA